MCVSNTLRINDYIETQQKMTWILYQFEEQKKDHIFTLVMFSRFLGKKNHT